MRSFLSILVLALCGSAMAGDIVVRIQQPTPAVRYVRTSTPHTVAYVRTSTPYVRTRVGFTGGVVATGYSVGRVRADDGSAVRRVRRTPLRTAAFGW